MLLGECVPHYQDTIRCSADFNYDFADVHIKLMGFRKISLPLKCTITEFVFGNIRHTRAKKMEIQHLSLLSEKKC